MSKPIWYYAKNRQKAGPVSLDALKKKLSLGELGSDALVWTVGWESWKKVCDVPELTVPEPPPLPPEEPPPLPAREPPITAEKEPTGPQKCPGCGYECLARAIRCGHCGGLLRNPESIDNKPRPAATSSEVVRATAAQTGRNQVSRTKGISILLIMVGLLLPVVSLGFVEGYNPVLGFVGSIPRMRVVFVEGPPPPATRGESSLRALIRGKEQAISYGYFFALGCILVCLGTAGVLFNQQSNIPKEQAKNEGQNSPSETPVDLPGE